MKSSHWREVEGGWLRKENGREGKEEEREEANMYWMYIHFVQCSPLHSFTHIFLLSCIMARRKVLVVWESNATDDKGEGERCAVVGKMALLATSHRLWPGML